MSTAARKPERMRLSDYGIAPDLAAFDLMMREAFERLPEGFRERSRSLVLKVEDFATDDILDGLGIDSEYDLLGLYQGVSLDKKSVADTGDQLDYVFLFRRPILHYWSEGTETLEDIVVHVLVHEIGHHFGLSDDDMEAIEAEAG
jgi:predicted Zn-dependent protease with MMP-like domain